MAHQSPPEYQFFEKNALPIPNIALK